MKKVIVRSTAPRIIEFPCNLGNGLIEIVSIKPQKDENACQEIPKHLWDIIKNNVLGKHCLKQNIFSVVSEIDGDDVVIPVSTRTSKLAGDMLVRGKDEVQKDVEKALEAGNIDELIEKNPELQLMIDKQVAEAVEKAIAEKGGDVKDNETEFPETIDELMESLGDDVAADKLKAALRDYAENKLGMTPFPGNMGVPKMNQRIREKEAEADE